MYRECNIYIAYIYKNNWIILLYTWNIVNQLYLKEIKLPNKALLIGNYIL